MKVFPCAMRKYASGCPVVRKVPCIMCDMDRAKLNGDERFVTGVLMGIVSEDEHGRGARKVFLGTLCDRHRHAFTDCEMSASPKMKALDYE